MLDTSLSALDRIRVGDCMHRGIYACDPDAPLVELAAVMAARHTHSVVLPLDDGMALVSDLDVLSALDRGADLRARDIAGTENLRASSDDSLRRAARLMTEHGTSHLVVVDQSHGRPVGVLSSTDIISAAAAAGGYRNAP